MHLQECVVTRWVIGGKHYKQCLIKDMIVYLGSIQHNVSKRFPSFRHPAHIKYVNSSSYIRRNQVGWEWYNSKWLHQNPTYDTRTCWMSGNIQSKHDIGLMSVFDLTVTMYKTRQVIMSFFDLQKQNHKMRHTHIFFVILKTRSFHNNLHILTYLEKYWFEMIQARNTKVGGVRKKLVFCFSWKIKIFKCRILTLTRRCVNDISIRF